MPELLYKELPYSIVGTAMEVHRILGSGFLEAVYQTALAHEFSLRGIPFEQLKPLAVVYKGVIVGNYVADFMIDEKIILELKAVSALNLRREAQAMHYLVATGFRLAILLNFGASSLEHRRLVRWCNHFISMRHPQENKKIV